LKRRMRNRFQGRSGGGKGQDETRSRRGEMDSIDHSPESESSTTSTHRSLGRPYTPSLPDDSGDVDANGDAIYFQWCVHPPARTPLLLGEI
jgi:hypothetical protein